MVAVQRMEHYHAPSAFEPVIFFLTQVIDLLGDRDGVDLRKRGQRAKARPDAAHE